MARLARQPSRSASGGRSERSLRSLRSTDEIPVARRNVSPALRPRGGWRRTAISSLLVVMGCAALVVAFPQPIRRFLGPPPVPGLKARLGLDGRLLGHFPYGERDHNQLVSIAPGLELQRDAALELEAMQRAATADGVDLVVLSAFRSIAVQNHLFFDVKSERNQSAAERARVSAPPGFSEHSTGYAVDLGDGRQPGTNLSPSFDQTAVYAWLSANANRFHFHLSFPQGNKQGVSYEPWHWRFEGSADALKTFEAAQRLGQ